MVNKKITFSLLFLALSFFIIGVILLIVAFEFQTLLYAVWACALLCSFGAGIMNREGLKRYLFSRRFQKASSLLLTITLTLMIVLMLNFIARKKNHSFDITKTQIHSLTSQSKSILSGLDSTLEMNFFTIRDYWDGFQPLLSMYESESSLIKLQLYDIEKELLLTQKKDIREQNTLEIIYKKKTFKKVIKSELDITNLLIKVMSTRVYKIYYTSGHTEVDLSDSANEGMSFFKSEIENMQYELVPIDLLRVSHIPKDASLLMTLAPKSDLLENELKVLKDYVQRGGSTFSLLTPNFSKKPLLHWNEFYRLVGINKVNGLILDRLSSTLGLDPSIVAVSSLLPHEITKGITSRLILPINTIMQTVPSEDFSFVTLMQSSPFPASWGEVDLKSLEKGKIFYDKEDIKGALPLGILVNKKESLSSHVFFSSASWLTNQYQSQSAHFNLALNSIAYTLGDNSLVTLNRPSLSTDPILLSQYELSLIFYFSVLFLPFFLFSFGIYFYQKRARG